MPDGPELTGQPVDAMGQRWLVVAPFEDADAIRSSGRWLACTFAASLEENR